MTSKIVNISVILVLLQTFLVVQGSETCEQKAEKAITIHTCCKYPTMAKIDTIKAIIDDLVKTVEPNSMKFHCLFAVKVFEAMKLKDFDKAAYKAYLPTIIEDPEWLTLYENATSHCIDILPKYSEMYDKIVKVPKEECDTRYLAFSDCVLGTSFMLCPAKSFTDSTECKGTRSFLAECYENEKAMNIYVQNQLKIAKVN
ncbi:general odorant-binding protein 67-like [Chironomus tepperi]|uniref:general odorant-binding protein 67-like n=1 Tax=Chironomus tepperi TaxID=113505 RepID=UPI00391F5F74